MTLSIVATANKIPYGRSIIGFGASSLYSVRFRSSGQNLMQLAWVFIPGSMKLGLLIELFMNP
jgi:hypothetical protein